MTSSKYYGDGTSLVPAALAVLAGIALLVVSVLLLAWVDRTVGDPKTLEQRIGVPVVATIPSLASSHGV
jgi:capsular polysaccharide biosynthesis protein